MLKIITSGISTRAIGHVSSIERERGQQRRKKKLFFFFFFFKNKQYFLSSLNQKTHTKQKQKMVDPVTGIGLVALIVAGGSILSSPQVRDFTKKETSLVETYRHNLKDLTETGMSTGLYKASWHQLADLNEVYRPRSAPSQVPTRNVNKIFRSEADIQAYLEEYGPRFYFRPTGEIPLGTTAQSNPNVEIPSRNTSIRGDPKASLGNYPRAWVDFTGLQNASTDCTHVMDLGAGEPTEIEECEVPPEGLLNRTMNPYGPGGAVQRINNARQETLTRHLGMDRSRIARPVVATFLND